MIKPPFESSYLGLSNEFLIIKIQSLDAEIDQNIFKYSVWSNSVNIGATDIKQPPFESSRWDESNDIKIIEIQSLDVEIICIKYNIFHYDNFVNIDATGMKRQSFEFSRREESNAAKIIEIQSLDAEIIAKHIFILRCTKLYNIMLMNFLITKARSARTPNSLYRGVTVLSLMARVYLVIQATTSGNFLGVIFT